MNLIIETWPPVLYGNAARQSDTKHVGNVMHTHPPMEVPINSPFTCCVFAFLDPSLRSLTFYDTP